MSKICPECGNVNPDKWFACANCGAGLDPASEPARPSPAAVTAGTTRPPATSGSSSQYTVPAAGHQADTAGGCQRGCEQGAGFSCGCIIVILLVAWFFSLSPGTDTTQVADTNLGGSAEHTGETTAEEAAFLGHCPNFDPPGVVVTQAEYNRLQTGMTYQQVARTICALGTQSNRTEVAGIVTEAYSWQNSDGSNLLVMFQNGGLVSKTATQLP